MVGRRGLRGEVMWPAGTWRSVSQQHVAFVFTAAEPGTRLRIVAVPGEFGPLVSNTSKDFKTMVAVIMVTSIIRSRNALNAKIMVTCPEIARLRLHVMQHLRLDITKTMDAHASRSRNEANNVPL